MSTHGTSPGGRDAQPATARPLRRDAERNRQKVLDAARALFTQHGLSVGLEDVARAADVGVGTVYRRFPTKQHLLTELFGAQVETLGQFAEAAAAAPDPGAALEAFLVQVVDLQAGDKGLRDSLLGAFEHAGDIAARARARVAPAVAVLLERAQHAGQVRPDVTVADLALLPVMVGAVSDRARGVADGLHQRMLALALQGLLTHPRGEGGRRGPGAVGSAPRLPGPVLDDHQLEQVLGSGPPPGGGA